MQNFSNKLKMLLNERSYNQKDLSELANISQQNLNNKLRRGLTFEDFERLSNSMGFEIEIKIRDTKTGKTYSEGIETNDYENGRLQGIKEALEAVQGLILKK
jgi:DNA-binding Xre family transcriptional regulator